MEAADHLDREAALAIQYFIDAVRRPMEGREITVRPFLHPEPDGLPGIGRLDWKVLGFVGFDERREDFETISSSVFSVQAGSGEVAATRADETCSTLIECRGLSTVSASIRAVDSRKRGALAPLFRSALVVMTAEPCELTRGHVGDFLKQPRRATRTRVAAAHFNQILASVDDALPFF